MGKTTFLSGISPQSRACQGLQELACNETMTGNRIGFRAGTNNRLWTISLLPGKGVVVLVMLMFVVFITNAADRYSVATGNWNATSTWSTTSGGGSGASVPVAGDAVFIEGGRTITVDANAACTSITFQLGAAFVNILTINTGISLNVSGSITIPRASNSGTNYNTLAVNAGILNAGSIAFTNGGGGQRHFLTISTGTVTISGNITQTNSNGSATITFTGAGLLKLGGSFLNSATGTFTASTGTVEYNGTAQTVGDFTYNNLTLSNSGLKTFTATGTVNGILSLEGTATTNGTQPDYGPAATLQYKITNSRFRGTEWTITPFTATGGIIIDISSATLTLGNARAIGNGSSITLKSGVLEAGTNLSMRSTSTLNRSEGSVTGTLQGNGVYHVSYTGNSKTTGPELSGNGLANVTVNLNAAQTLSLDQNRTPDGNVTITAGSFDLSTFTFNRSSNGGTLSVAGSLLLGGASGGQGASNFPSAFSTLTMSGGTVNYNKLDGGQTIVAAPNYNNLIMGNTSGTQTAGNNLSVSGTLTTTASGTLNMGTYSLSVVSVSHAGTLRTQNTSTTPFTNGKTWGGTVTFDGSSAQTVPASTFNNLTLNNTNGASLAGTVTVNNTLSLTAGVLNLAGLPLIMGNSAAAISGAPFSATKMIIASGTGEIRKNGTSAAEASYTFPIGDNTVTAEYSPVTVTFSGGTYSGYVSAKVADAKHPNNANTTNFLTRYWTIGQFGLSGYSASVEATYLTADITGTEANLMSGKWSGSLPWTAPSYSLDAGNNILTSSGITTFSDFTGISDVSPSVTIAGDPSLSVCQNASLTLTATPVGDATFTYAWNTGATTNTISPSTAALGTVEYSVTVTDGNGFTASNSASVTVNAPPSCSITGSDHLCPGGGGTYSATSGMSTYNWSISGSGSAGGATNEIDFLVNAGSTCDESFTLTSTVTDANGCVSSCQQIINLNSATAVSLDCPTDVTTTSCQTQSAINAEFADWLATFSYTGGCNSSLTILPAVFTAPPACGGSTTVMWIVSSDCEASSSCQRTFTVTAPDAIVFDCPVDATESTGQTQTAIDAAFALWLSTAGSPTGGCNPTLATSPALPTAPSATGGSVTVTWTVSSDCAASSTCSASFTVGGYVPLSLSCAGDYTATSCQSQSNINAEFADWLVSIDYSGGCNTSATNDNTGAPNACGGSTTVTWTVTSDCGADETCSATFTVENFPTASFTSPDPISYSSCDFNDQAEVETTFNTWLQDYSTTSGCSPSVDYGTPTAPVLCTGGTTSVTYTVTDQCGSPIVETVNFKIDAAEAVQIFKPADYSANACAFANQTEIENAFNTWLIGFTVSGGCFASGDFGTVYAPDYCLGGTTTVTYTVTDICSNGTSSASFTIVAPTALDVHIPNIYNEDACIFADQSEVEAAFAAWLTGFYANGGCSPVGDYGAPTAPILCTGGTTNVEYIVTSTCQNAAEIAHFTVNAPLPLSISKPANFNQDACNFADQTAVEAAFASWLDEFIVNGGCSPAGDMGSPVAPTLCTGGTTTVTFNVSDLCDNGSETASFTINTPAALSITKPANFSATACDYADQDAVDAAFATWLLDFTASGGCSPRGSYGTPTAPILCTGGTTTVTYTVTDLCATGSSSATFSINAPAALSITKPADFSASACDYADQDAVDAAFATWLLDFTASGGCSPRGSYGTPTAPVLCTGGTTTVTYSVTDLCATGSSSATFSINAPAALSITEPANFSATACDYADQDAVDAAFATWLLDFTATGGCSPQASYGTPTAPVLCTGGTTTVTYTVTDLCATGSSSATFSINAPATLTVNNPGSVSYSSCDFADQAAIDLAFNSWLTDFTVSGGCNPLESYGTVTAPIFCAGGTTTVTYEVSDLCVTTSEVASFTIDAAPSLTLNCAGDYDAASCSSQTTINSLFADWLLTTTVTGGCNTLLSTSPAIPDAPLACGGSTTVTWTVSSDCAADQSCSASFSVAPATEVTFTCAENITEVAGQTQETINTKFEDWLATATYSGGCGVVVTTDPAVPVAPDACGGSVTVYWTVSSTCEADITCSATFSVYTAISMDCNYPDQCRGNQPFNLTGGLPSGGTYSGTAVIGGMFYPELGSPGPNAVTYTVDLGNGCMGYAYCDINILNTVKSVVYVGTNPTDDYPNLSGATGLFADINAKGICSTIIVYITTNITEPGIIALNQRLEYGPGGYFVIIKPNSPSEKLIQGNFPLGIIRFNGADRLVINGQFNTNNAERFLRFRNNSTVGPVFNFTNGATINNISWCTIEGANTNANSGLVVFGTSTSVGNSYNNIEYSVIKNGIGIPANGIYSAGSVAAPNHSNYFLGNYIKTFNQNGVYVTGTGNGGSWYINGNMFSWENPGSPATLAQCAVNLIPGNASHDNFVANNVIGGSEPGNLGMWTNSGAITFKGISVSSGTTGILNNIIRNITLSNPGGTSFMGIELLAGASFIGAPTAPNVIGDPANPNSIKLAGLCNFFGIRSVSTNPSTTISGNVIANITSTVAVGYPNMYGIYVRAGIISRNNVYKLGTSNTATLPAIFGIMNLGIAGPSTDFYDNMVSLDGGNAINPKIFGIQDNAYAATGPLPTARYAHNTVEISGAATNFSKTFAYQRNYNGNVEVKNNIFYNSRPTSPVGHYAISSANTLNWTSDYNSLFAASTSFGFWGATNYPNLAAWKLITSQDANSISVAPVFVSSPSDLHIDELEASNAAFNNVCPAVPYAYWDIDNTTRTGFVDMGADEFDAVSRNAPEVDGFEASLDFYPNPFESGARIAVGLAQDSKISLVVYNILGDKVADITEENLISGKYEYSFASDELPAGVYLLRMFVASGDHNNVIVKRIIKSK